MPYYDFVCSNPKCENIQEEEVGMNEFKDHHPKCDKCGSRCDYKYTPTVVQFALKDGPSGSWPSKGNRFKKYRDEQSAKAKIRQKDRYGEGPKLMPNYQGQQTEDWREAQSLAMKDKDRNEDPLSVASTYNEHINKESEKKGNPVKV
jgi:hypothetical protein